MLSNKVLPTSMTICLPMKELASSLPRKAKSSPTSSSSAKHFIGTTTEISWIVLSYIKCTFVLFSAKEKHL